MKLIILHLDSANKTTPMSENVVEIQINNQPCNGINLTTQHTWATEATQVATVHDEAKKSGWVIPRPSAIFHVYAPADTPWLAWTLSHCTPVKRGKVSSNSLTYEATKFGDYICPICVSTFKCLFIQTQLTWALIDTDRDYHLGDLNFRSDHSSSFPSSILPFPLIAPPGLQLYQYLDHLDKPHRTSISSKGPIIGQLRTNFDFNHSTSTIAHRTKHSVLSLSFFHRCKQSGLVRVFLVLLGFLQTPILKCTIMAYWKCYKAKILSQEDTRCLRCLREEEKLASSKLGMMLCKVQR
jgi:hypothetical protein